MLIDGDADADADAEREEEDADESEDLIYSKNFNELLKADHSFLPLVSFLSKIIIIINIIILQNFTQYHLSTHNWTIQKRYIKLQNLMIFVLRKCPDNLSKN